MPAPALNSALEAAEWFYQKAEAGGWLLESEKLQHLLFLAQVHYAIANNGAYLLPSLFICDDNGFSEPGLAATLKFGRPLQTKPVFSDGIETFLNLIWQKYASLSLRDLTAFVKNTSSYSNNYRPGEKNITCLEELTKSFRNNLSRRNTPSARTPRKISFSQNGPVVVSQWQPRKLNSSSKENKHA